MVSSAFLIPLIVLIASHALSVEGACPQQPCQNGGNCANSACNCVNGWGGPTCVNNVNVCETLRPCLNGGTCTNKATSFVCNCITGFTGSTCNSNAAMTVNCGTGGSINVVFDLTRMPWLDPAATHLNDASCKGTTNNAGNVLTITTTILTCGVSAAQDSTNVKYVNSVRSYVKDVSPHITREYELDLPFSCTYARTNLYVHDNVHIKPDRRITVLEKGSTAQYSLSLALYKEVAYTNRVINFPYASKLKDPLYFQVNIITNDPKLTLFIDSCKATGTTNPSTNPSYSLLNSGCKVDSTLTYSHTSDGSFQRFNFNTFRFTTNGINLVYVHCYIKVCLKNVAGSSCKVGPKCGKRRRRGVEHNMDEEKLVTIGPLELEEEKKANVEAQSSKVFVPVTATVAAIAVVIICAVVVAVVYRRRQRQRGDITYTDNAEMGNDNPLQMAEVVKQQC